MTGFGLATEDARRFTFGVNKEWMARSGWAATTVMAGLLQAATNTAEVRLYGLAVRLERGTGEGAGSSYSLSVFSGGDPTAPNGELWNLLQESPPTHATLFVLEDPTWPGPALAGEMELTVPEEIDVNGDGVPDFYQVAQGIPSTTTITNAFWIYTPEGDLFDSGTARLEWQRPAGSSAGTCRLTMTSGEFGQLPTFQHVFEIYEFEGTLRYVPSPDPIRGEMEVARVGFPAVRRFGPIQFTRDPTNALNWIEAAESSWTNELGETLSVTSAVLERDPDYAWDYFGAFGFLDGDLRTPEPDYEIFFIGINDTNDADGDGIPDLTDLAAPAGPRLTAERAGEGLKLTVLGETGRTYEIERRSDLSTGAWAIVETITAETNSVTLSVSAPTNGTAFWRARQR